MQNGTPHTEIDLHVKEICRIIETCNSNGVAELKFGKLCITFKPDVAGQRESAIKSLPSTQDATVVAGDEDSFTDDSTAAFALQDENVLRELEVTQMMIEDPSSFEQMMVDSHLNARASLHDEENHYIRPQP